MAIFKNFSLAKLVWKKSFRIVKEYPRVLLPFGVVGSLQGVLLVLLFLAPRYPLSVVLAPPIRAFWGELYLHYPANFLLLPRLFNYGNIIISLFIGSLMTGMMVIMVYQANKNVIPGRRSSFKKSIKKYLTLVAVWVVAFILVSIVFRGPKFLISKYYFHNTGFFTRWNVLRMAFIGGILISLLVEMFFAYAVAAVMIENKRIWRAIGKSFSVARRFFLTTFILVAIPTFFIFLVTILKWKIPQLMKQFFPEITLYILGLGIGVSLLINYLVTTSVTVLFLMNKDIELGS